MTGEVKAKKSSAKDRNNEGKKRENKEQACNQSSAACRKSKAGTGQGFRITEGTQNTEKKAATPDWWDDCTDLSQDTPDIDSCFGSQPKMQSRAETGKDSDFRADPTEGKDNVHGEECEKAEIVRDLRMSVILQCDRDFIDHLLVTQQKAPEAAQDLKNMLDEFQKMKAIALQVVEKNAHLEGRIKELTNIKPNVTRTFAEVTKSNSNEEYQEQRTEETSLERKAILLVRSPDHEQKEGISGKVKTNLVKHFDPAALGLKEVGLRQIKGGIAVTAAPAAAIQKLKDRLQEHHETMHYDTKLVEGPQPEIRLISVDKNVESADIPKILLEQNGLEGSVNDIKVVWRSEKKFGSHITLRIANLRLANEVVQRGSLYIGWSKCRAVENVYLPKCTFCTRVGHKEEKCFSKGARCTECSGEHYYKECKEKQKRCPLCVDAGKDEVNHSMWDGPCPTFEERYQKKRKEIGFN